MRPDREAVLATPTPRVFDGTEADAPVIILMPGASETCQAVWQEALEQFDNGVIVVFVENGRCFMEIVNHEVALFPEEKMP
jgi:hypothetical protein